MEPCYQKKAILRHLISSSGLVTHRQCVWYQQQAPDHRVCSLDSVIIVESPHHASFRRSSQYSGETYAESTIPFVILHFHPWRSIPW